MKKIALILSFLIMVLPLRAAETGNSGVSSLGVSAAGLPSDGYASTYVNTTGDTMTGQLIISTAGNQETIMRTTTTSKSKQIGFYSYSGVVDYLAGRLYVDTSDDLIAAVSTNRYFRINVNGSTEMARFSAIDGGMIITGTGYYTGALTLAPTSNQLILGVTRTVTVTAPTPATTSRVWTIPDITGNGTFMALEGTQTVSGAKTFTTEVKISSAALTIDGTSPTATIGGHRIGLVEGMDGTVNHLIQYSSAVVTGSLVIDFTDSLLKDYASAPFVIVTPIFDSDENTALDCNPHTVTTTGMTIECVLTTGDGVGMTVAADASARQVNYILMGTAP